MVEAAAAAAVVAEEASLKAADRAMEVDGAYEGGEVRTARRTGVVEDENNLLGVPSAEDGHRNWMHWDVVERDSTDCRGMSPQRD